MPRIDPPAEKFAATVEMRELPDAPDLVAYQITGATCDMVQGEVNRVMRQVEMRGGVAEFRTPQVMRRGYDNERWVSRGYASKPTTEQT